MNHKHEYMATKYNCEEGDCSDAIEEINITEQDFIKLKKKYGS